MVRGVYFCRSVCSCTGGEGGQRLHRGAGMSLGLVRCLFTDHIRSPVSQIPAIVKTSALSRFGMAVNTPCTSWIGITLRWLRKWEGIRLCHHRGGWLGWGVGQRSARDYRGLTFCVISQIVKSGLWLNTPSPHLLKLRSLGANDSLALQKSSLSMNSNYYSIQHCENEA